MLGSGLRDYMGDFIGELCRGYGETMAHML